MYGKFFNENIKSQSSDTFDQLRLSFLAISTKNDVNRTFWVTEFIPLTAGGVAQR